MHNINLLGNVSKKMMNRLVSIKRKKKEICLMMLWLFECRLIMIYKCCHSPLFMGFWIHKFSNSPVYTFSTLFYAKIMYFYMELLKAIDAILLPLKLLYFFPKKQGFFGNFYEILILKIVFFSIFAIFCWKNQ